MTDVSGGDDGFVEAVTPEWLIKDALALDLEAFLPERSGGSGMQMARACVHVNISTPFAQASSLPLAAGFHSAEVDEPGDPQNDRVQVRMDLSAMGITTTEATRLIGFDGASSLAEGINHGDLLIVEEGQWADGRLLLVVVGDEMTVGRCLRAGDKPVLRRDADYPDVDLSPEQIVGEVVGLIRRL